MALSMRWELSSGVLRRSKGWCKRGEALACSVSTSNISFVTTGPLCGSKGGTVPTDSRRQATWLMFVLLFIGLFHTTSATTSLITPDVLTAPSSLPPISKSSPKMPWPVLYQNGVVACSPPPLEYKHRP